MSALAASAVTRYPNNGSGEYYTKSNTSIVTRSLVLVLTGQGGQSNTIGAAALGFSRLLSCTNLFDDTNNKGYLAAVDPVTNTIVLFDGAAAPAPVDVTSSAAYITVTGNPKV